MSLPLQEHLRRSGLRVCTLHHCVMRVILHRGILWCRVSRRKMKQIFNSPLLVSVSRRCRHWPPSGGFASIGASPRICLRQGRLRRRRRRGALPSSPFASLLASSLLPRHRLSSTGLISTQSQSPARHNSIHVRIEHTYIMSGVSDKPPRFGLDKTPPLQLEFIDHGDDNARKRVRSHAMKDVQRRKRWDYARSTDNKRRNEEKKRSAAANTAIRIDPDKRPEINRQAAPVTSMPKSSHQSDQSESDSYDAPSRGSSIQSQTRTSPLQFQNQYQSQTNYQDIPHRLLYNNPEEIPHGLQYNHPKEIPKILTYQPSGPNSTSLPFLSNRQHPKARPTRRGTPEETSEPSLADDDDESATGSESQREYYNPQSPESDKWGNSQTKGTETQQCLVIADSDYELGMSTDSDVEGMFPKGGQNSYDRGTHPAMVPVPNPKSLFSAARFDPFDTLAKHVKPEDRALVDHRASHPQVLILFTNRSYRYFCVTTTYVPCPIVLRTESGDGRANIFSSFSFSI